MQRGEHRLELGLGLGELGERIAVRDDAPAGVQPRPAAVRRQLGAPDRDRPRPVPGRVDPADGAPVAVPLDPLDGGDQRQRVFTRVPAERRGRAQRPHQLDDVRRG